MGFFSKSYVKTIPVIDLKGAIAPGQGRRQTTLNIDSLRKVIDEAFNTPGAPMVVLDINCPGGSPAQSELIANHIRRRAAEKQIPVFAFVQDVAASGGYWLACAADFIFAAKTSMVGSIGVISAGMAFHKAAEKLGIEQRVYTAGESKSKLSPFKPENPEDVKWLKAMLEETHELFKDWVKERRGIVLDDTVDLDKDVFNGNVWHAKKAVELGLIDGIADMETVLNNAMNGQAYRIKHVHPKGRGLLSLLFNSVAEPDSAPVLAAEKPGAEIAERMIEIMQQEEVWAPYRMR